MIAQKDKTKLLISIVSYNSLDYVKDCLLSIQEHPPACPYAVVVVDNASQDGTAEMIQKQFGWVTCMANTANRGFAAANNQAIRSRKARYVLLLNSDCRVFEGSLDRLVDFLDQHPQAGVAGPSIINSDGSPQHSCRRFPSMFAAAAHSILTVFYPGNPFSRRYKMADIDRSKPFEVDWVSGSAMAVRGKALQQVGLLDERFFMYAEDVDLCYRMWQKKWKVYYCPYSKILHHIGGSSGKGTLRAALQMQKSVLLFYLKNYGKTWRIIWMPALVAVLALRIFFTMVKLKLGKGR